MDRIQIVDLGVCCIIGANDKERTQKQDVLINLTLFTDISAGARSDRLEDALDYREVRDRVVEMVQASEYFLLEALAESIARVCLEHRGVTMVKVRVDKPGALTMARTVAVEIERG